MQPMEIGFDRKLRGVRKSGGKGTSGGHIFEKLIMNASRETKPTSPMTGGAVGWGRKIR